MNFKKFISGVSAFAIAASAFAGMAVTANAFDTVTIDYEDETPVVDWTSANTGRYTAEVKGDATNHYMSVDAVGTGNNGTTVSTNDKYTAKVAEKTSFTMTFDMQLNGGNNQVSTFKVNAPAGEILKLEQTTASGTEWKINGDDNKKVTLAKSTWYSFKITRVEDEDASKDFTYLTVKDANGNDVFERAIISSALSANGGVSGMSFETKRYYSHLKMDNVVVRDVNTTDDLPQTVSYKVTINCVAKDDQSTIVKSSSEYIESGEEYTPTYAESFDDDNYRYTYESGSEKRTITADTTYTLVYNRVALADHTVTVKTTGYDSILDTITLKDNKSGSYAYPRYILSGTDLYQIKKSKYDQGYVNTFNNVTEDIDVSEEYALQTENVVYFKEAEDIATLTKSTTNNNIPNRCSSGNAAYAAADAVITNLPAGQYKIAIATFGNKDTKFTATIGSNAFETTTKGYFAEEVSEVFTISEATDVVIGAAGNGGSSPKVIDYIYIVKTGNVDPSAEAGEVTNVTTYSGDQYDGSATSASVAVSYANMLADKVITLTYGEATRDVSGATGFTGNGNIVVGVVIQDAAVSNPVFTAGVR